MKKKVLIFYSNTGSGHLRAAQALKEELELINKNYSVILYDGLEKLRFGIKIKPSSTYSLLSMKLQRIYNLLFTLTNNKAGTRLLRLITRKAAGRKLRQILGEEKPDLIISTHGLLSKSVIKKPHSQFPFITVVTDLGKPHRVWFDNASDKIIIPTNYLLKFAKDVYGDLEAKTTHIDYPLNSGFRKKPAAENFTNTLLLLGGGTGSGNLKDQVKTLASKTDKKIIVVCGRNKKLQDSLTKLYKKNNRVEIYGFADNLPELYSRSDIILTKAGPGAIVETVVSEKPLIITGWVGLQEKENIDFVLENNLGVYEPNSEKLPAAVNNVYKNFKEFIDKEDLFGEGAKSIAKYINQEYLS